MRTQKPGNCTSADLRYQSNTSDLKRTHRALIHCPHQYTFVGNLRHKKHQSHVLKTFEFSASQLFLQTPEPICPLNPTYTAVSSSNTHALSTQKSPYALLINKEMAGNHLQRPPILGTPAPDIILEKKKKNFFASHQDTERQVPEGNNSRIKQTLPRKMLGM